MNCTWSMSQMGGRCVLSIIYEFELGMIALLAYVWDWFYIYMNSRWTYYIFFCMGIFLFLLFYFSFGYCSFFFPQVLLQSPVWGSRSAAPLKPVVIWTVCPAEILGNRVLPGRLPDCHAPCLLKSPIYSLYLWHLLDKKRIFAVAIYGSCCPQMDSKLCALR